jgi:hypothetical protein
MPAVQAFTRVISMCMDGLGQTNAFLGGANRLHMLSFYSERGGGLGATANGKASPARKRHCMLHFFRQSMH